MNTGEQKSARQNLDRDCWIRLAPDQIIDALLLEVSHSGARLALRQQAELPPQFDLLLTRDGKVGRTAKVTRQSEDEFEVIFLIRTVSQRAEKNADDDDTDGHVIVKL